MTQRLLLTFTLIVLNLVLLAQNGSLKGKILDKETGEVIPFTNIVVELGGRQYSGATSDFDGIYMIKPLPPGRYTLKTSHLNYHPFTMEGVVINADKITFADIKLTNKISQLEVVEILEYKIPLIAKDQTQSGGTLTAEEISKMPSRSADAIATTVGGVFSEDGERGSVRGARTESTITYIDGVRVRGSSSLPQSAIDQVTVITGGVPAQYGDATGGVINVTTKGPSRDFSAGAELISSELTDPYGYNSLGFNMNGPLFSRKDTAGVKKDALLGFFLSGELQYIKDPRPLHGGFYRLNDEVLAGINDNPLRVSELGIENGMKYSSEYVTRDDLTNIKTQDNTLSKEMNLAGKIDVRTGPTTNLTFGGSTHFYKDDGGIGESDDNRIGDGANIRKFTYQNLIFNSQNNPEITESTWRAYGRFIQKFPTNKESKALFRNFYYSLQADYSKYAQMVQDKSHRNDLFDYGYIGQYNSNNYRYYELGSDSVLGYSDVYIQQVFTDTLMGFKPGSINPELAQYTQQLIDMNLGSDYTGNIEGIQTYRGLLNGDEPDKVYNVWANAGKQYNGYSINNLAQISVNANGSFDIKNHAIQFGFSYEQRIDKAFSSKPVNMWTLMRQQTNKHIQQLDLQNPHAVMDGNGVFQDTVYYDRLYSASEQSFFDRNLRESLGLPINGTEWIDVDSYNPESQTMNYIDGDGNILTGNLINPIAIDMFSADELLNSGNAYVSYYGYDHAGRALTSTPGFDDFFTKKDAQNNFLRQHKAFQPTYMAGYIQDKFAFDDLIFNVGVRVDRYDANQLVLKDPFLLYNANTVAEATEFQHPGNMRKDYVVYVDDIRNPTQVNGYRNGYTWYDASGAEIADPSEIEGPSGMAPYLQGPIGESINSSAFTDYQPQLSIMPRVSFSFPISDEALFFAHYDIYTKRPTSGTIADPVSYYFLNSRSGDAVISNPNLKPEKTIDYELGFQQKISASSSIKLSAYYREIRDMVQVYRYTGAYPRSYISFNNVDFGTIKGFIVAYDLRRTGNIWLKTSYTMQFADGTGSSATDAVSLIRAGQPNLRIPSALDYDRRHSLSTVVDYRFKDGKDYNGPRLGKSNTESNQQSSVLLLANTGLNLTFTGGSGTPYTSRYIVDRTIKGSKNGSRLPWNFRMDARIDKDIPLKGEQGDHKHAVMLNLYLQVLNVLNTPNILSVYSTTGNADDDGTLLAAFNQAMINQQTSPEAYRDQYATFINNPYNFSLPRRIRIGLQLNFMERKRSTAQF